MTITAESETDFTRKGLPPITDHAFWRMLRVQANTSKPMAKIAAEIGVDTGDLCDWIMAYKGEPKPAHKPKPYMGKDGPSIGAPKRPGSSWSPAASARLQTAWQRQRDGAAAARKAMAE
jgi:hypothetical protein